jgi:hypothetical protein
MSVLSVQPTFPIFTEADGQPLENGYIWIGTANLDPQVNPISVYWDAALTQPAAQPIRTINGYPAKSGSPGRLYVNSDYSIRVQNKNGSAIYSAPESTERFSSVVTGLNAIDIQYSPSGTGAVASTVQAKLRENVSVKDFGAVGDGVTDDTASIIAALNYANGKEVYFPSGVFRITSPLSTTTSSRIKIRGAAYSFLSHDERALLLDGAGSNYSVFNVASVPWATYIKCDGCNMIGAPDVSTTNNASSKTVVIRDLVAYGQNGAKAGVYFRGNDDIIENCTFALFEWWGIASRGQITSVYRNVCTIDCGWNLANTGAVGNPGTYYSGCGMIIMSNQVGSDYTTLDANDRPTTLEFDNLFFYVRSDTVINKSGLRGMQATGLLSGSIKNLGGYTGNYFNKCYGTSCDGYHNENYQSHGVTSSDATPAGFYLRNCGMTFGAGYNANVAVTTVDAWAEFNDYPGGLYPQNTRLDLDPISSGPWRSSIRKLVTVTTPGSTVSYSFNNLLSDTKGFCGFATVVVTAKNNYANYRREFLAIANHKAGVSGWQPMPSVSLASQTSTSGGFGIAIAASWSNDDLLINVTWGASWGASNEFYIDVGMFGGNPISV